MMDSQPKFDSLLDALDAIDIGVKVDETNLKELIKDLQGDHECGISFGPEDSFGELTCDKNPGHTNFLSVKDFTFENIPLEFRTENNFKSIQQWSALTVKINARYISLDRPATFPDGITPYPFYKCRGSRRVRRFGTGSVESIIPFCEEDKDKFCPCPLCENSDNPERDCWMVYIATATHVVFDTSEAVDVVVECFYDSDDDVSEVKKIYGVYLDKEEGSDYEDICKLICVTHDRDLMEKLEELTISHTHAVMPHFRNSLGVLISHPHGKCKRITVGHVIHLTIPICPEYPTETPIELIEGTQCRLPLMPWSQKEPISELFNSRPGETCILPGLKYILPKDAKFARRFFSLSSSWFVFPPGTVFMLNEAILFLPPEAEFWVDILFENPLSYLTYDVDSCPGSSGAGLLQDGGHNLFSTFPHSGSLTVYNKSGLRKYAIFTSPSDQINDVEEAEDEIGTENSGCLGKLLNYVLPCFP